MQKNVAGQKWTVFAFDRTDNTPKTGDLAQITAKVSKDGAAAVALTDVSPVELESGYYEFDLAQAETNADKLTLIPVSSTGDIQVVSSPGTVFTTAPAFNLLTKEVIKDEVWAKTMTELAATPGATGTVLEALTLQFMALVNEVISNSDLGKQTISNAAGAIISNAPMSEAANIFTREKFVDP